MSKQSSTNDAAINSPVPSNGEALTNALADHREASTQRPKTLSLNIQSFDTNVNSYGELTTESASAEALVYPHQEVARLNEETEVYHGIPEADIDPTFVESIVRCAIHLMVHRKHINTRKVSIAGGQMGIVVCRDKVARFVTAKHNLMSKKLDDETTLVSKSTYFRQQGGENYETEFGDPNCSPPEVGVELRDDIAWKKGVDVSWGAAITVQSLGEEFFNEVSHSIGKFEMVDADFEYEADQKVGFAIFSPFEVTTDKCVGAGDYGGAVVSEEQLGKLFGPAGSVTIYTGAISSSSY
jgi:hypothetical protein